LTYQHPSQGFTTLLFWQDIHRRIGRFILKPVLNATTMKIGTGYWIFGYLMLMELNFLLTEVYLWGKHGHD
jgi:hypothetical protein